MTDADRDINDDKYITKNNNYFKVGEVNNTNYFVF